jgi:subtilisin family serine protease
LDMVKLTRMMDLTAGKPEISIGLIDGPVAVESPGLNSKQIRYISKNSTNGGTCMNTNSAGCLHGTFIAGMLSGTRDSPAPAICPACRLLVRPIFIETATGGDRMPSATPEELAQAIFDCVDGGARVLNLSVGLQQSLSKGAHLLKEALDHSVSRGVLVVAAAGNQGTVGSSALTRHAGVIPVVGCDLQGTPLSYSNLGSSIAQHGLRAPGESITSLRAGGHETLTWGGTSVAAPLITGAIALLWSEFPAATAAQIKFTVTQANLRRTTVIPPVLDAWAAYETMLQSKDLQRP